MNKVCTICGSEYIVRGERRKQTSKCCSVACYNKTKIGHTPRNKNTKSLTTANSGSFKKGHGFWTGKKRSEEDRKIMSEAQKRCTTKFTWLGKHRPNISGENAPTWKGGVTPLHEKERRSVEYKAWRRSVFERDNYTCQCCSIHGTYLVAHHINNFAERRELRHEMDNGITLCKNCHIEFHNQYGKKNNTKEQVNMFILQNEKIETTV